MSLDHMPSNPDFGTGVYRRRLRFVVRENQCLATLDDTHHAMWLVLTHDAGTIADVAAGFSRRPTTVCEGAVKGLAALAGLSLSATSADFADRLPAELNCTHLGDLARWASSAALRGSSAEYSIIIPDQAVAPAWIEISRNSEMLHRWLIDGFRIIAPDRLAGGPLMRGFVPWARKHFTDVEFETALMLQRGVFVARARPYLVDRFPPIALTSAAGMEGACFSYTGENLASGTSVIGYVRDFSRHVEPQTLPATIARAFEMESTS